MTAAALAAALGFGVVGGVLAGLVGVGGGVVLVPFLYLLFDHPGWSGLVVESGRVTLVAHATSLVVIVPTALSALRTFHAGRLVPWRAVAWMGAAAAIAAVVTTRWAPSVPGSLLRAGFAAFLLVVGARLLFRPTPTAGVDFGIDTDRPVLGVAGGIAVGVFSALLGVGGGLVAIPLLIFAFRLELGRVAAASMGVVVFAALAGATGYLTASPDVALPEGSVGWVHVPVALALMPGAIVGARWGAKLNQRMETEGLRRLFAVVLIVLGLRLAVPAVVDAVSSVGSIAHSGARFEG